MSSSRKIVQDLLKKADIEINGSHPWDIQIHNEKLYSRVLRGGTIALGESYMDGWWEVKELDSFINRALQAKLERKLYTKPLFTAFLILYVLRAFVLNLQSLSRAFHIAKAHYDIGNDLYVKMLDPWMQYSCGYWEEGVTNLQEAQEAKLDLIARKLKLKPGMRVLDVGCGWGGLAKYLATHYDVSVCGITVSKEQARLAREWINNPAVEIKVTDYRTLNAKPFDRIVSVGMFEHVGYKNYRIYMQHMCRLLKDDGLFLLHTIGRNVTVYATDPWIHKYIFPNSLLPSPTQVSKSIQKLFILEDWHNFGPDYDKTLIAWYENFNAAWPELRKSEKYDDRFYRMWDFYLRSCAGGFRSRKFNLWQIVLSKGEIRNGYQSIR